VYHDLRPSRLEVGGTVTELVFIHGAGDSGAVWQRQVERFGDRYPTLAVDLPGHGERLVEAGLMTIGEIAEDVVAEVRARGFGAPVVVGHSMGGAAALTIALKYPDLPRALVLAGSGARLRIRPELIEEARQRVERARPGTVAVRVIPLEDVASGNAPREAREWLQQRFGCSTAQATYADFVATNGFDVMDRLAEVVHPTLVIGGAEDRWTPPRFQQYFAQHLPNVWLVMLPRAGHYPFVEQEEAFNRELEQFLAGIDAR
jgi:pimeloyl-ACP methyl ester carboxylesterase